MTVPASPDPVRGLINDYVDFLGWIYTEIQLESGPLGQGFRGIADAMRPRYERIDGVYTTLEQAHTQRTTELTDLSRFLGEFGKISGELQRARYLTDPNQLTEQGKQLLADCLTLLRGVCVHFTIALPTRKQIKPFKGPQVIVVSDLVGYTPRALAMIPAGTHLGDEGVVSFVEQLDERIKQQLKGAFEDLKRTDRWDDHLIASTGDGGIVRFDRVSEAIAYARAIHVRAQKFNETANPKTPYQHRVGIAWGTILLNVDMKGDIRTIVRVGIPFIQAVRMEGAAQPGGIAIGHAAWQQLVKECEDTDQPLPTDFTEHTDIPGKPGEPPYHGWVFGSLAPKLPSQEPIKDTEQPGN